MNWIVAVLAMGLASLSFVNAPRSTATAPSLETEVQQLQGEMQDLRQRVQRLEQRTARQPTAITPEALPGQEPLPAPVPPGQLTDLIKAVGFRGEKCFIHNLSSIPLLLDPDGLGQEERFIYLEPKTSKAIFWPTNITEYIVFRLDGSCYVTKLHLPLRPVVPASP